MLSILGNALPEDCCQIIKLSGLKMFPSENPHFGLPRGSQHHTSLNESLTFHSSTIKSACSKRQWHSASTVIWYTIWYIWYMIWYIQLQLQFLPGEANSWWSTAHSPLATICAILYETKPKGEQNPTWLHYTVMLRQNAQVYMQY